MKRIGYLMLILIFVIHPFCTQAQDYGDFPDLKKDSLLLDFELFRQGLEKFQTGIYWYTTKATFDSAFAAAHTSIDRDMNVMEFYKILASVTALTKEDHTNIYLSKETRDSMESRSRYLPLAVKFLGEELYCIKSISSEKSEIEFKEIESINDETPLEIAEKLGSLYANDGVIKPVKLNDLSGFNFARYYYLYYGNVQDFNVKLKGTDTLFHLKSVPVKELKTELGKHQEIKTFQTTSEFAPLKFIEISDSVSYLGVHTFLNKEIRKASDYKRLRRFLRKSFKTISEKKTKYLIIDISKNGGGNEGNDGLLYSYIGDNFRKYNSVVAKTRKAVLDNGTDKKIKLKTYGIFERIFTIKKMPDGSLERRNNMFGFGLRAYKKSPKHRFTGDSIYVMIGPLTYSGGSEFASMVYSNERAKLIGQKTGGSYYGNTSGITRTLVLPHSKINVAIPALQFKMNVKDKVPFGEGVPPDYKVISTIEQYKKGEDVPLNFILNRLINQ